MEYTEIKRDIETGKLAPVYFFFGEESYYTDELTVSLIKKIVTLETRDFNCDVFQSEESDADQVVAAAASFPMVSDRRIVVLKSVQKLSPGDKEKLLAYARKPSDSTCLVLTAGKIDRRQTFFNALIQLTRWIESKPLYDNQAEQWVEARLRDRGFAIAKEAAGMLVQWTGYSLWNLVNETEKVMTFCWEKKRVEPSDIIKIAGFSRKYNSWELSDSVGGKNFVKAVNVLHRLMQEKQSPAGLIMELSRRIFLLMQIRVLLDHMKTPDQIRNQLGLNPFFNRMYIDQAGRYTLSELEKANRSLLKADLSIKTGTLDPLAALTLAVHDMVHGETQSRYFS